MAILEKTRFLAHMGVAYFAFHRWVWNQFKAGAFASGHPHRLVNMGKAAIALLFTVHELQVALGIADKSNSKLLHALASPIHAFQNAAAGIATKLKGGAASDADLTNLKAQADSLSKLASGNGFHIKDIPVAIPGVS